MKKWMILMFAVGCLLPLTLTMPSAGRAEVNLNLTIPLPGPRIAAPPSMVVVPGSYVYFAPDIGVDLFFYHGYWYRPYRGEWYFSAEYNGPWGRLAIGNVPPPLVNLPPDYRDVPPGYERMPYPMVQRNWRRWEEERYWDNYGRHDEHPMPHHGHGMGMGGMGR